MLNAIRQTVTVQNGGVIVLREPELPAGTQVEVIVMVEPGTLAQTVTLSPDELQRGLAQALTEAGYNTREKIIELVRAVKRDIADERERAQARPA